MTADYDVVVIGDGLAGRMAAIAAAREGVSVAVVSDSESTLRNETGLVDVLGYRDGDGDPIANPFDWLESLPETHPYRIVGEDGLREGLGLFDSIAGDRYRGGHTDQNGLLPTTMGTVNPTARYPASFEPGLLSRNADTLFVGIQGLPGIDGEFLAGTLAAKVPYPVRGTNIELGLGSSLDQPNLRLATALDRNEEWPGTEHIRERLAARIDDRHAGESRVGLPAVLGREDTDAIRRQLQDRLGVDIFEIPTAPPSLPGIRLDTLLRDAVDREGIAWLREVAIAEYDESNGTVTAIRTADHQQTVQASQFVLATGGLIAGGLAERDGDIVEPIFDFPTTIPATDGDLSRSDPLASQPFARAGLVVDGSLRPRGSADTGRAESYRSTGGTESTDRSVGGTESTARSSGGTESTARSVGATESTARSAGGTESTARSVGDADSTAGPATAEPAFNNMRACGAVLGGFDYLTEHSGGGVAIATGVRAGRLAAREVKQG